MGREEHWQRAYGSKRSTEVSWYAEHLDLSMATIRSIAEVPAKIIDVGGGASTLVDDLLAHGYRDISVLDVSPASLNAAKARLGENAKLATWIVGDATTIVLAEAAYDVWHDRAVFHFLTDSEDRRSYINVAARSLKAGGHAVMATFAPDGPSKCSGLDVRRYDAQSLGVELGPGFALKSETRATHRTPTGGEQKFIHCLFQKVGAGGDPLFPLNTTTSPNTARAALPESRFWKRSNRR